jgi:hypothetical protein
MCRAVPFIPKPVRQEGASLNFRFYIAKGLIQLYSIIQYGYVLVKAGGWYFYHHTITSIYMNRTYIYFEEQDAEGTHAGFARNRLVNL